MHFNIKVWIKGLGKNLLNVSVLSFSFCAFLSAAFLPRSEHKRFYSFFLFLLDAFGFRLLSRVFLKIDGFVNNIITLKDSKYFPQSKTYNKFYCLNFELVIRRRSIAIESRFGLSYTKSLLRFVRRSHFIRRLLFP